METDIKTDETTNRMFFAASTGGFYSDDIHGDNRPDDCIEITHQEHQDLLATSLDGKVIKADANGKPVAVDYKPSDDELVAHIKRNAKAELKFSDGVAIRCLKAGVAYPSNWLVRDKALRSVVDAAAVKSDTQLPPRPEFPAGT